MAEFDDENFNQAPEGKSPYPTWLWFFLLFLFLILVWQTVSIFLRKETGPITPKTAFTDVSNRDMSLMLWQTPELRKMRGGTHFLPAFDAAEQMSLDVTLADLPAEAPLNLFFRYHVWRRLLYGEFQPSAASPQEFQEFLGFAPEWLPANWPAAPDDYKKDPGPKTAPKPVQIAFQGWKNTFRQSQAIEAFRPTDDAIASFLENHPNYRRNRWRNIIGPDYLKGAEGVPLFVKQAIFNGSDSNQKQ